MVADGALRGSVARREATGADAYLEVATPRGNDRRSRCRPAAARVRAIASSWIFRRTRFAASTRRPGTRSRERPNAASHAASSRPASPATRVDERPAGIRRVRVVCEATGVTLRDVRALTDALRGARTGVASVDRDRSGGRPRRAAARWRRADAADDGARRGRRPRSRRVAPANRSRSICAAPGARSTSLRCSISRSIRRNTVIGTRSFGDDPSRVAALGAALRRRTVARRHPSVLQALSRPRSTATRLSRYAAADRRR